MASLKFTSQNGKVVSIEVSKKMEDLLEDAKTRLAKSPEVKEDRVLETLLAELHENIEEKRAKTTYEDGCSVTVFDVSAKELKNALKHI